MKRGWLYGKNKIDIFFKTKMFDQMYHATPKIIGNKGNTMSRIMIFLAMFIVSIPDLIWGILNVLFGGLLYGAGFLFKLVGARSFGSKLTLYGWNIAVAVDQFFAVKAMGQDPDVTISMALGVAKVKHEDNSARVNWFWLLFGKFVNLLFNFQKDHVKESIEREEKAKSTVIAIYRGNDKTKEAA